MSVEDRLKFLTIPYEICQNELSTDTVVRCAEIFLIPALYVVSFESFREFFAKNMKYILPVLESRPVHLESDAVFVI